MYAGARSRIKVNGFLTDPVFLRRFVRQGCPLSSMLYTLIAEPLVAMIMKDTSIKGIASLRGQYFKIAQYADDVSIVVKDGTDLRKVLRPIEVYEEASGAKLNKTKSVLGKGPNVELGG